jgi:hypothetical protein
MNHPNESQELQSLKSLALAFTASIVNKDEAEEAYGRMYDQMIEARDCVEQCRKDLVKTLREDPGFKSRGSTILPLDGDEYLVVEKRNDIWSFTVSSIYRAE